MLLLRQAIELLTPASCVGCGREGGILCQNCRNDITLPAAACFACGRLIAAGRVCQACRGRYDLAGAVVAAHYEGAVKELILSLKFARTGAAATVAAQLAVRALPEALTSRLDGVTAVPVAPGRWRERGYNQSELIARRVARHLGLPYRTALRRSGATHQLGAGRRDRLAQVKGAFEAIRPLEGNWLVVDDVMTTGATLDACACAMRLAGATRVYGAVVAGQRG